MEETMKRVIEFLSMLVEAGAAIVIGFATVEALIRTVLLFTRRNESAVAQEDIRLKLG